MNNNQIQVFNFEQSKVRTFVDEQGNPWFCGSDVCKVLGYAKPSNVINTHCVLEGTLKRGTPTSSGSQEITYLDERNLYRLIMRSKLPNAEKFQDWVCGEVIPSIRKTGQYSVTQQFKLPDFTNPAIAARAWAEQFEKAQALQMKVETDKPLVEFAETIQESSEDFLIRKAAKLLGVKVKFLFGFLRQQQWIFKTSSEPYAVRVHQGLMTVKVGDYKDKGGEAKHSITGYLTFKGLKRLHDDLKSLGKIPQEHQLELNI